MIFLEGPRVISPFPSGLGVARPRSEPRLLCFLGAIWASSLPAGRLVGRSGWPGRYAAASAPRSGAARRLPFMIRTQARIPVRLAIGPREFLAGRRDGRRPSRRLLPAVRRRRVRVTRRVVVSLGRSAWVDLGRVARARPFLYSCAPGPLQ